MPGRKIPLVTNEIYHVFNRGIDRRPTFTNKRERNRAIETLGYYKYFRPPASFSKYTRLEEERKREVDRIMGSSQKLIELLCFVLMPNHFHFLLKQLTDGGIAQFLSNFQNSYTRYFNIKHGRDGSLFMDQFKCIRIENEEQLVHVSRYIHLNPYTGYVVKSLDELEKYQWSSFSLYLHPGNSFVETDVVLGLFQNIETYKDFVFDQANYQRELKKIEHLLLE